LVAQGATQALDMTRLTLLRKYAGNYLSIEGRPLPTFIIIGAQKGGTSSLFSYLSHHPSVIGSFIKEVQYFTRRYSWGVRGYRAFFPKVTQGLNSRPIEVGESTPFYLFDEAAPARIHALLPGVRLIAMLREPVERAYSHHKHNQRHGLDSRPFAEAIEEDLERYKKHGISRAPGESVTSYRHHSYVRRGFYANQLQRWVERFPERNLLMMKAEDFFADPATQTARAVEFLGLPPAELPTGQAYNQYAYVKKDRGDFPELARLYEKANADLEKMTGINW
jgi:hypothetical protein